MHCLICTHANCTKICLQMDFILEIFFFFSYSIAFLNFRQFIPMRANSEFQYSDLFFNKSQEALHRQKCHIIYWIISLATFRCYYHLGRVEVERSPRMREIGVRSPAATTWIAKNRMWQLHCQTLGNRCECHGSLEMNIIKGRPVSQ